MWKNLSIFVFCVAITFVSRPSCYAQQEIPPEIAKLPAKGVVGVKLAYSLGGVTIRENTGMAVVLSVSPLVIVTTQELLVDSETIPEEASLQLTIQTYVAMVGGMGGMSGMGSGGMGGGGYGMGMGPEGGYQTVSAVFNLSASSNAANATGWQLVKSEKTPLLFGFAPAANHSTTEDPFGGSSAITPPPPIINGSTGRLAEQAQVKIPDWKVYRWLGGPTPVLDERAESAKDKNGVAVSPEGSLAVLSASGRPYARSEILEEYLIAFKKLAAKVATNARPLDVGRRASKQSNAMSDPFGASPGQSADPFSHSGADPFSGGGAEGTGGSPFDDRVVGLQANRSKEKLREAIVDLVIRVKSAESEAERKEASSQLQIVLAAEFDAQRSLKSEDIAALKARVETLEKAEQKLVEQRDKLLKERLEALLR